MSDSNTRKYETFRIPERQPGSEASISHVPTEESREKPLKRSGDVFHELVYDESPNGHAGGTIPDAQQIVPPERDEVRERFDRMREIERHCRSSSTGYTHIFDRRTRQETARIFYQQAVFMKDFEDDYPEQASFSSYFPYYQMMGYTQLRTYFTWRSQVRNGSVRPTSLSFVFLYLYELLNNIGKADAQEGLESLLSFWTVYREHDSTIDPYVIAWMKDYHIYYPLPQSFGAFVREKGLVGQYPNLSDSEDSFGLFCAVSSYDIRKSVFFTGDTETMITDCFDHVLERIREEFERAEMHFDDALFRPARKMRPWRPFRNALFHPWLRQPDRKVVLSESEIYQCVDNEWTFSSIITTGKGRQFIGYVMKKMESVLRECTDYRFRITAKPDMMHPVTQSRLEKAGLDTERIVMAATRVFYREATKTVVAVDPASLARIREEATATQNALLVEEQAMREAAQRETADSSPAGEGSGQKSGIFSDPPDSSGDGGNDGWVALRDALDDCEQKALFVILQEGDLKAYADRCHIMVEVLADGINGKAMDCIGDSILDEELQIYEEYRDKVREMGASV